MNHTNVMIVSRGNEMRRLLLSFALFAAAALQGCGGNSFHYINHQILVTDQSTRQPISNALVTVKYAPVYCGGPFAFLGAPKIPQRLDQRTNEDGVGIVPLELEWPYGFTMQVKALGYNPSDYTKPRDLGSPLPPVPESFALEPNE